MTSITALTKELDAALSRGSPARRGQLLRQISDLFLKSERRMPVEAVEVFDELIMRLAVEIEDSILADLSAQMAKAQAAPQKTLRVLAHGDIRVARPVLEHALGIGDEDLLSVVKTRTQEHRLAIAGREVVSPPVTDALVERGEAPVLHVVTANPGARFSDQGFGMLVNHSSRDERLLKLLVEREDLPADQVRRLIDIAGVTALQSLRSKIDPAKTAYIDQAVRGEVDRIRQLAGVVTARRNYTDAYSRIAAVSQERPISETDVVQLAMENKFEDIICALAMMSGVGIRTIEAVFDRRDTDQLTIICRALNFKWATMRMLIGVGFSQLPTPRRLEEILEGFDKLSLKTAKRIMRFLTETDAQSAQKLDVRNVK